MSSLNSLPSIQNAFTDGGGYIRQPWIAFLAGLVSQAGPIAKVSPTGSPFSYTASQNGSLAISGGTVSAVSVSRASIAAPTGVTAGLIPMSQGDTVKITYSGAPTLNFIPR